MLTLLFPRPVNGVVFAASNAALSRSRSSPSSTVSAAQHDRAGYSHARDPMRAPAPTQYPATRQPRSERVAWLLEPPASATSAGDRHISEAYA